MMQWLRDNWPRLSTIAIIFSFIVNCLLVTVLVVAIIPLLMVKTNFVEPLLMNLDMAFQGLGETTIDTTVEVDQAVPIVFDLPLNEPLDLDFILPINQDTVVTLNQPVPLSGLPATFTFPGGGGAINGSVSLALPAGLSLPVHLEMEVPVQRTIPVSMTVPVNQPVQITMSIPVTIQLGEAGLDPAVEELRAVFAPVNAIVQSIPDGFEIR